MSQIDNDKLRQLLLLAVIILLGVVLFNQLNFLLPAFLGAITLYELLRVPMFYLRERQKWNNSLAATVLMLISFIVLLVPIFLVIEMLSGKVGYLVDNSSELANGLKGIGASLKEQTNFNPFSDANIKSMQTAVTGFLPKFLGATFNSLTVIGIMYFFLYFMLVNGRSMEKSLYNSLPLKENNIDRLLLEVRRMVFSNALGIPLIALIQGVITLVGYLIFGVPNPFFWFTITCFMAMVPVVGAAVIWAPLSAYLLINGNNWQGIGLITFCVVIVGSSDNIFRFMLQKKIGNVHPLITILGVLIGINLFGFIGLIFGPLLISMFILLVKVYRNEFHLASPAVSATIEAATATEQEAPAPARDPAIKTNTAEENH